MQMQMENRNSAGYFKNKYLKIYKQIKVHFFQLKVQIPKYLNFLYIFSFFFYFGNYSRNLN